MKIKTILVSQPAPTDDKNPYAELAKKFAVKIDFRAFIKIEAVPGQEFRQERINILDHSAIVLTSRNAVDHFFRMCKELRITVPETMKYFCVSESVAYYVQKYIVYRKRKVFIGKQTFGDLMDVIKKHKDESVSGALQRHPEAGDPGTVGQSGGEVFQRRVLPHGGRPT